MMKRICLAAVLCVGLLLTGCGKQDPAQEQPAALQAGYLDISGLNEGEPYSEAVSGSYEMADETAEAPAEMLWQYEDADGAVFLFDKAGRLRRYTSAGSAAQDGALQSEETLRGVCDEVLASYIADYGDFSEITSQYNMDGSGTYNLAMEHVIAEGIADYALIRLDLQGEVFDLSISYADADGDAEKNFVTDEDKAYFETQVTPYLTALDGYSAEVTYVQYKHLGGRVYAFYEVTYADMTTGVQAGTKLVAFVK